MKNLKLFAIIIMVVFAFNACKVNDKKAVSKIAKEYLDDINNKNYSKAKKLCTTESASMIDMLESISKMDNEHKPIPKIEDIYCNIDGDKATFEYRENGDPKKINLVKIKGRWLVDMKKETPDLNNQSNLDQRGQDSLNAINQAKQDSINAANNYFNHPNNRGDNFYGHGNDTMTFFDIGIIDLYNLNGNVHIKFNITNRSDWNIKHFWLETYISNKSGKFIQKDELMFDGILKTKLLNDISNINEIKEKNKVELILKDTKIDNLGEVFMLPLRIQLEQATEENMPFDIGINNVSKFIKLRNDSAYSVNITF